MGRPDIEIQRFQMHSKMEFRIIVKRRTVIGVTAILQSPDDCIPPSYKVEMIFKSQGIIEPDIVIFQDTVVNETGGKSHDLIFPPPNQKARAITHALAKLTKVRSIQLFKALFRSTKNGSIERQNFVSKWRYIADCFHLDRPAGFRFSELAAQILPHGVA